MPSSVMANFFFQAEDGIRAGHVTGVQTCALPISVYHGVRLALWGVLPTILVIGFWALLGRSEERRVGKGGNERRRCRDYSTEGFGVLRDSRSVYIGPQ